MSEAHRRSGSMVLLTGLQFAALGSTTAEPLETSSLPYQEVLASDGDTADAFGHSLDVAVDRMVVGMAGDTPFRAAPGRIYVFDRAEGGTWDETILEGVGDPESRAFSYSVALSADRIVAGGPYTNQLFLFERRQDGSWREEPIRATDADPGDWFGHAVAIDGDRIVVGAPNDDPHGESSGSAHVIDFDGAEWVATKLMPSDGLPRDEFGWSVAVAGDVVVVGQPHRFCCDPVDTEAVYVFEPDGRGGWSETKIVASDSTDGDSFGFSVATSGDVIVVGAPRPNGAGAAYVYQRSDSGSWQETKLTSEKSTGADDFGFSVDVDRGLVAVGAPHRYNGASPAGTAHIFESTLEGNWKETLFEDPGFAAAPAIAPFRWFGHSVGLTSAFFAVSAPHDDTTDWDAGIVYEFAETVPEVNSFVDDDGSVDENDIEFIAARGITRDCNPPLNDRSCPSEPVTRGQMAAFLDRSLDLPDTEDDFFDDDAASVFEASINRLAESGITFGCNPPANTHFCPFDEVTRAEMAALVVRGFGYTAGAGADLFTDDDGSVFEPPIDRLGTAGVTRGCNPPLNDRFCPDTAVLRDQMASFLARALGN